MHIMQVFDAGHGCIETKEGHTSVHENLRRCRKKRRHISPVGDLTVGPRPSEDDPAMLSDSFLASFQVLDRGTRASGNRYVHHHSRPYARF